MFAIVQAAGWPIWPLIIASIIALAVIVERFLSLRDSKVLPAGLLERVEQQLDTGSISSEFVQKLQQHSPLGMVFSACLRQEYDSREHAKEAVESAGRLASIDLERFLNVLGTIASISPLMGLFGTIVGMIEIFAATSPGGSNDPTQLAHGISVALYNTGLGLVIAIPATIFWRHFRAAIDRQIVNMEAQALRLLDSVQACRKMGL